MSILLITHDLGVVADMCDEAIVMYAGQVVETGPVEKVLLKPRHPYTSGLLASTPQNEVRSKRLKTIPGTVPPAWAWPEGCRFRPRCPHALEECKVAVVLNEHISERRTSCVRVDDIDMETTW